MDKFIVLKWDDVDIEKLLEELVSLRKPEQNSERLNID